MTELAAPLLAAPEPVAIGAGALAALAAAAEALVDAELVRGVAATSGAGVANEPLLDADADVVVVVDVVASGAIVGSGVGPCPVFGTVCCAATVVLTVVELALGVGDGEAALDAPEGNVVVASVELAAVVLLELPALLPVSVVLEPDVPKLAGAAVAIACALPSASAWFVEPVTFVYFCVTVPEGEVAPSSTAVLAVRSKFAMLSGVCTSPRTSSVVSRLPRYAMPPGARTLLA